MVGKYTDIILDFVQFEGGQQTMPPVKMPCREPLVDPRNLNQKDI
jgi:hypothetical protein